MRVPSPVSGTVNRSREASQYLEAHTPDLSPIAQGLSALGAGLESAQSAIKQRNDQHQRFEATRKFIDFNLESDLRLKADMDAAAPDDLNFADRSVASYETYENEFVAGLPVDLQDEFRTRAAEVRQQHIRKAVDFETNNLKTYYVGKNDEMVEKAKSKVAENPDTLEGWKAITDEAIDASPGLSDVEKYELKKKNAKLLETLGYGETLKRKRLGDAQFTNDLGSAARAAAAELGTTPEDLLTVISYETGGKFSTGIRGGAGNRHIGLIQFGPEEQKKYGVYQGQPLGEQMKAVVRYLRDRGFKPGMSLLDLYSTINAGSPGRYSASDANNGGAPGSVYDKVATQMEGHKAKAAQVLGGTYSPDPDTLDSDPRFANVPYEDRIAIRSDVETGLSKMLKAQQEALENERKAMVNDLYNGLMDGSRGRLDYENMVEQGLLNDYDERKKALGIIEEREKAGADLRGFQSKLAGGGLFDPTNADDKKGADAWFGDDGATAVQNRDEKYISDTIAPMFGKTGIMPPKMVDMLGAMTLSNDGRNANYAYQALSILENQNPLAYATQVPQAVRERADVWEELKDVLKPEELALIMRGPATQEGRNAAAGLREEAQRVLTNPDVEGHIKFDTVLNEFDAYAPTEPIRAMAMEAEWRTLLKENFVKTGGDWDAAQAVTLKQLKRVWSVTTINNGYPTLMKHAPELYIPKIAGSHEWATKQVRGELGLAEDTEFSLISDDKTSSEVEKGRPPSYKVAIKTPDGWKMATDAQNRVVRQVFTPMEQDLQANEKYIMLENKKSELLYWAAKDNTLLGVETPPEVTQNIERLQREIAELEGQTATAVDRQDKMYDTPAQVRVKELQKQVDQYREELYSYTGVIEEWPKTKAFAKALDDLEKAEKEAAEELKNKSVLTREKEGALEIFTPPENGVEKNWLTDALGITEAEVEEQVPPSFNPVGRFAVIRQTDSTEVINGLWDKALDSGAPPSRMRAVVDKLLGEIPATRIPDADKEKFEETLTIGQKSPLARIGMKAIDPSRVVMYKTRSFTNLGGAYTPTGDWLFFASNSPESFVHEMMHRGMKEILPKLTREERELLQKRYAKGMSGEEAIVRMLTKDLYPERQLGDLSKRMNEQADFYTSWPSDLYPVFKRIKAVAEEEAP